MQHQQLASRSLSAWALRFQRTHDNAEGVIARADEALYRAKQQGRNRWEK
ncbi:MAG: diguanylate cyclase domain-containing protein [Pantoea agglomerans]